MSLSSPLMQRRETQSTLPPPHPQEWQKHGAAPQQGQQQHAWPPGQHASAAESGGAWHNEARRKEDLEEKLRLEKQNLVREEMLSHQAESLRRGKQPLQLLPPFLLPSPSVAQAPPPRFQTPMSAELKEASFAELNKNQQTLREPGPSASGTDKASKRMCTSD